MIASHLELGFTRPTSISSFPLHSISITPLLPSWLCQQSSNNSQNRSQLRIVIYQKIRIGSPLHGGTTPLFTFPLRDLEVNDAVKCSLRAADGLRSHTHVYNLSCIAVWKTVEAWGFWERYSQTGIWRQNDSCIRRNLQLLSCQTNRSMTWGFEYIRYVS